VVELLAPKAYEKRIDIAWAIDPAVPNPLMGDEVRVRQIITNLVGNAIKFTDRGGVLVTVARSHASRSARDTDDVEVAIVVEDTGIGIAPEALPALFSEFEQAENAVRRRQGGTGLGLAISRRLARAMGGDIVAGCTPTGGSIFTATIRLETTDASESKAEPAGLSSAQHVLLALDRAIERRALRLSLEGAGIPLEESNVAGAGDLIAAAAQAGEPFTRIIIDGRSGCERAAELLAAAKVASPAGVQGVIVLDTAAKADFAQFREAGFDAYLVRPVRPQSVLTHLGAGQEPAEPPQPPPRAERQPKFSSVPSVLLVEDNDINALLARRMLEKVGCKVRHCVNGREAVDVFQRVLAGLDRGYDLVLMDAHMPVLDGLEATRAIHQLYAAAGESGPKPPPIVAVTANAFDEDRRRCLEAGMDDYLAKPFDRDDLGRLLERWCRQLIAEGDNASA
jgi:CheY-like chemotaxis protein